MNEEKERGDFERWYAGDGAPSHAFERDGDYKYMATRIAWRVWEARASLNVSHQLVAQSEKAVIIINKENAQARAAELMINNLKCYDANFLKVQLAAINQGKP